MTQPEAMNWALDKVFDGQTPEKDYYSIEALSYSGMKDLAVSPLRYWYLHLNPKRPVIEPSPEMQFGSALHCLVLEPEKFRDRYACELDADDYPGCLVTMDDLRGWLRDHGTTPRGTRKADLVAQVQQHGEQVYIYDVLQAQHAAETAGKVVLKKDDWRRVYRAAESLLDEPRVQEILASGTPELAMFSNDRETGVPLKCKMDWITPGLIFDLKSFSQKHGKSIDKSISDAIWYESYHRQAYLYSTIRGWPHEWKGRFIFAFVESEEPHEVRLKELAPKVCGEVNLYWERARIECRGLMQTYAECMKEFGTERPWRYAQDVETLDDSAFPGVAY